MLTNSEDVGMISILKIATARLTSADYVTLKSAEARCLARGRSAMLVDLSAVRRVARSGLAALVEFQSEAPQGMAVGFFGARERVENDIARCALSSLLTLFKSRKDALVAPRFRARQLAGVKAVLLVAGSGSRMAPLSAHTPKPLLDFLGRPVLDHVMRHLSGFGIRDFILNPGHFAPQFHAYVRSSPLRSVQFLNEGQLRGDVWQADPLGSASTLRQLHQNHNAFDQDFLVFCGDAVTDIDVAALMEQHRASGADVTIAAQKVPPDQVYKYGIIDADRAGRVRRFVEKPSLQQAPSQLASCGIYVVSPRALSHVVPLPAQDIAQHLLPGLLAAGRHLQVYDAAFNWVDMGCPQDYFAGLSRGLRGLIPGVMPLGHLVRRHVWAADGANVSPRAVIVGPAFIGADAVVEAGAKLEGPVVVGAGARVCGRSLVRRSVISSQTRIGAGTWVDDMIVAPDWALDHRFSESHLQSLTPLEGVVSETVAEEILAAPLMDVPSRWGGTG
ncbi:NDP-sugar synthase [uncultured Shimia sp.]|uniref:NDP-sugar synthase n=1 Tax=uncultured Shimia sp. TaxID=573152 RepID=UPI00261AB749|nr:NDP-sugar synthase [uncultured Shimia sp.]